MQLPRTPLEVSLIFGESSHAFRDYQVHLFEKVRRGSGRGRRPKRHRNTLFPGMNLGCKQFRV